MAIRHFLKNARSSTNSADRAPLSAVAIVDRQAQSRDGRERLSKVLKDWRATFKKRLEFISTYDNKNTLYGSKQSNLAPFVGDFLMVHPRF